MIICSCCEMEKRLSLDVCFQLGKALRYSDAEKFLTLYDSLLLDSLVEQDQLLTAVKEWARQISELSADDFALLHAATLSHTPKSSDISIATEEPVSLQLSTMLDKLRMTEVVVTSDSGAISDYSENTELDCFKSHSSTSLTFGLEERESGCSKQSDSCGSAAHHITTSILTTTPGNSEQNTATQPVTGALDYAMKDLNVPMEAQIERSKCNKDKGTTKQTSTLDDSLSSQHTEEVAWSKEEKKDLTQSCEQCKPLKIVGSQEKRDRPEKRGVSETTRAHSPAAQQTKRYYCGHHNYRRRNCGYHGYTRNSSQQSNTSTRDAKTSNSCSPFNHGEVAAFLWKRWMSVQKELL